MIGIESIINMAEQGFKRRQRSEQLFDLNFWHKSESYKLIREYTDKSESVLEIGCLTGHHLILLALDGYKRLFGIEFVREAVEWGRNKYLELNLTNIEIIEGTFPSTIPMNYNIILLFDVLEHVHNIDEFLRGVLNCSPPDAKILLLVPQGAHYFGKGHINFYPNMKCLENLLVHYFDIVEMRPVEYERKIFAVLKKKADNG